ncbi:Cleavage stimulation factor subunit 3 [Homalodisca vitripennis]|nr:Cleavage stimulation factor subunit 3 [Homalodisca vitripennis]
MLDWGSEKLVRAQTAIRDNRWDLEAWGVLIREAQTRYINEVRPFFEELVANFPTCGRYWKIYIEQEMRGRNFEKVEKWRFTVYTVLYLVIVYSTASRPLLWGGNDLLQHVNWE